MEYPFRPLTVGLGYVPDKSPPADWPSFMYLLSNWVVFTSATWMVPFTIMDDVMELAWPSFTNLLS